MPQHVVERHQVAQRVEHRDGEIDIAGEVEVPHVRLDDSQAELIRLGQLPGPRAHRRAEVECGDLKPAAG